MRAEVKKLWRELGMDQLRKDAISEIDADVAAGKLTWEKVEQVIVHPSAAQGGIGETVEGQEFEGVLEEGELVWETVKELEDPEDVEPPACGAPLAPLALDEQVAPDAPDGPLAPGQVQEEPGDDPEQDRTAAATTRHRGGGWGGRTTTPNMSQTPPKHPPASNMDTIRKPLG